MNIYLPIITNLVIAILLCVGALRGIKKGFLYEFIKFILVAGIAVGCYFLTPVVNNLLLNIEFISQITAQIGSITSVVFFLEFCVFYLVLSIIMSIIFKFVSFNKVKKAKVKGLSRKDTKELRKQERELRKKKMKLSKTSKAFGAIFGLLISFIFGFTLMLPVKTAFNKVAEINESYSDITKGYEYTIYGQIDNLTNINDLIEKIGE